MKNKRKQSQKSQQQSIENMQQLNQKLQQMQSSMEMEMMQENLDKPERYRRQFDQVILRSGSFDERFQQLNPSDPRFIELSQEQLKLKR